VADTDDGLYLETNRSWSIDDRRLQFQFATEVCREIRGGELGRLYRNGSYAGVTPRFWGSLDAICGPDEWRLWGLTNCGKGEPGQVMSVSHGAAQTDHAIVRGREFIAERAAKDPARPDHERETVAHIDPRMRATRMTVATQPPVNASVRATGRPAA